MCRFVRDGEPDIGEYRELADGTGICVLADMNGDSEEVVVSLPDGTMPENISDLELLKVPTTMHGPESGPLTPAEVAERMARTDFIIEEYKGSVKPTLTYERGALIREEVQTFSLWPLLLNGYRYSKARGVHVQHQCSGCGS